ncbi:hypothetical protein EZS27_021020 [termite gut metagenome]|uniref:Uncharacterized protein n=1 Tax=termite gut metagenome TaxID=433724 RepID=A0A5J4R932_9ZZZZ
MEKFKDMSINYPRGSEWRKWDLHVHTPASIVYNYRTSDAIDVWELFIQNLESLPSEIKVLGINDYLFIDGYRKVLKYKCSGRLKNIELVLPVIEFRLAQFGGHSIFKRINFHVIFSNEINPDVIQNQFLNGLTTHYKVNSEYNGIVWGGVNTRENLTVLGKQIKSSVPQEKLPDFDSDLIEGFNNLNLSYDKIMGVLKNGDQYFRNKFITAIGKTEWDAINWTDGSIADKKRIINEVDIVFTAAETNEKFFASQKKLSDSNVNCKLLDCSDAHHNIDSTNKDRIGNCNTWIKADPTFEGLKQVLYEYEERVRVQDINPDLNFEKALFTEIQFSRNVDVFNDEMDNVTFKECTIPLNNNLISIIGGRGTGKSILIDYKYVIRISLYYFFSLLCKLERYKINTIN